MMNLTADYNIKAFRWRICSNLKDAPDQLKKPMHLKIHQLINKSIMLFYSIANTNLLFNKI